MGKFYRFVTVASAVLAIVSLGIGLHYAYSGRPDPSFWRRWGALLVGC